MAAYAKDSPRSARRARHPAGREEGGIRASREGGPLASWLIALIVLATGSTFTFVVWGELMSGRLPLLWLILIIPFTGLLLAGRALVATVRYFRYGRPVLHLETVPCPLGGMIRGTVEFPGRYLPLFESAELELQERHLLHRKTGKKTESRMETVWRVRVPIPLPTGGNSIPLVLPVPGDGKPTEETGLNQVAWRACLRAATGGADLNVAFDLPVVAVPGGDPEQTKATIEAEAARKVLEGGEKVLIDQLRREKVALLRHPAGLELRVRPLGLRRFGFGIVALFMLALPAGYWLVALRDQQSLGRWLGFAVLATVAALVFIPTMTKSYRVLAGSRGLRIVRHILGVPKVWQIPYEAIESIQAHSSMSTSDANGTVHYYDLKMTWREGDSSRTVRLGLGVTDQALATALAHMLRQSGEKPQ